MAEYAIKRRYERRNAVHRVLLKTTHPSAVQEIVDTIDISSNGAKVAMENRLASGARGTLELLGTGCRVPCRIVWQSGEANEDGHHETGLELGLESSTRAPLWDALTQAQAPLAAATSPAEPAQEASIAQLWSSLVSLLEKNGVLNRQELVAELNRIAKSSSSDDGGKLSN